MKQRILQLIEIKGINKTKFYNLTGLSNGFLDKSGNIGVDKLENILNSFPDVNPTWLVTGRGDIFSIPVYSTSQELLDERIQFLEDQLKFYKNKSNFLEELSDIKNRVEVLEEFKEATKLLYEMQLEIKRTKESILKEKNKSSNLAVTTS